MSNSVQSSIGQQRVYLILLKNLLFHSTLSSTFFSNPYFLNCTSSFQLMGWITDPTPSAVTFLHTKALPLLLKFLLIMYAGSGCHAELDIPPFLWRRDMRIDAESQSDALFCDVPAFLVQTIVFSNWSKFPKAKVLYKSMCGENDVSLHHS